jgi:hypothetical protein
MISVVLLKYTRTNTVTKLQELFVGKEFGFMIVSLSLSLLSLIRGHVKWITVQVEILLFMIYAIQLKIFAMLTFTVIKSLERRLSF